MPDKYRYIVHLSSMEMEAATFPLADRKEAEKAARDCKGRMCQVEKDDEETVRLAPPRLFHLPALQAEAGRLFGYAGKQTKELALSLYRKGLLTDPETGSRFLPVELGYTTEKLIRMLLKELPFLDGHPVKPEVRQMFGPDEMGPGHAILPVIAPGGWGGLALPQPEQNLLYLVGTRVVMAAAGAHIHEDHKSQLTCNYHTFFTECRRTRQEGYRETEARMEAFFGKKQAEEAEQKEVEIYLGKVFGPCDTWTELQKERPLEQESSTA